MSRRRLPLRQAALTAKQVRQPKRTGKAALRHRTVDTLARLYEGGVIDHALLEAGREFERAFTAAALDPLRAMPLERVLGNGQGLNVAEGISLARWRLHSALTALGGQPSPAGSACWEVLGLGRSLREWALGHGWQGRPLRQEAAQGILVAALGVLAAHYGLVTVPKAS
jgi:hypothetical protein